MKNKNVCWMSINTRQTGIFRGDDNWRKSGKSNGFDSR